MKITNEAMMIKCNNVLKLCSTLRVVEYNKNGIVLNNGKKLIKKSERDKFIKRLKNNRYHNYLDDLYSLDENKSSESLKEIKHKECSKNGKKAWEMHRDILYKSVIKNITQARESGKCFEKIKKYGPWCKGLNKNTDERLLKMSQNRIGKGNPMYGKKHTYETKQKESEYMKNKIKSGLFTPNIHNRLTHFSCIINGKKYRSSWEAFFALKNPSYEYEKLRISYNNKNKEKIYIVDFISYEDKIVVEIKPERLFNTLVSKSKEKSLIEWCNKNGFKYKRITEKYIIDNFDEKIIESMDDRNKENIRKVIKHENKKY